ncbi:hypothetical protein WJX73_006424 [Symbiochloris irregularis]|uniref:RPGRIP1 C-terminal domain-containing protein n=1 Tax=Symbiochloris irregularis TaxID=706552 RepID=A0AAW1P5G2_9CHLO
MGPGPGPVRAGAGGRGLGKVKSGAKEVDMERYLSLQQDYLAAKKKEKESDQTIKDLSAQLARTEEAAKRVIMLPRKDQRLLARQLGAAESKQGALQRALSSARQTSGPSRSSTEEAECGPQPTEADPGDEASTPKQQSLANLKVSRLEAQVVQLRGENRGLRQQMLQASREHDGKAAALQKQIADLQASLKSQSSKAAGTNTQHSDLQTQHSQLQSQHSELKGQHRELKSQLTTSRERSSALERQLEESRRHVSEVRQELEEARSLHARASSQLRQEMAELASTQNRRSGDEDQQIAMLNATNAHLLQRVEQSVQEAHVHRTAQLQAERQATQLGIELSQLKGSLFDTPAPPESYAPVLPGTFQGRLLGASLQTDLSQGHAEADISQNPNPQTAMWPGWNHRSAALGGPALGPESVPAPSSTLQPDVAIQGSPWSIPARTPDPGTPSELDRSLAPVCQALSSDIEDWPQPRNAVVVAIETVQLVQQLAARVAGQRLFVMFSFLPSLCSAQQQQTRAMPATQQPMAFDFCLAHHVSPDGYARARTELGRQLRSSEPLVLPFCLCLHPRAGERLGPHHQLAYAEQDLKELLRQGQDLRHSEVAMVTEGDQVAATMVLSLVAVQALQALAGC